MKDLRLPIFLIFARMMIFNMVILFIPIYFLNLGLNGWQMGFLLGLLNITALLLSFGIGIGNDRITSKTLIFLGCFLLSLFFALLNYFTSFSSLIFVFLIGGVGLNMFMRSLNSLFFKILPRKGKGTNIGLYNAFMYFGILVGVVLGSILIYKLNFHFVFKVGAICFFALMIISLFLKKTPTFRFGTKVYFQDILNKEVIIFAIIIFLFTMHWGAEYTSYSLFLKQNLGLSQLGIGMYMVLPLIALSCFGYYFGKRVDKGMKSKSLLHLGMLLSGTGILFMVLFKDLLLSMFFRVIHEIGDAAFGVFLFYGIAEFFPKKRIGGDAGFIGLVLIGATLVGNLIYGPIGFRFGYEWPHIISGVLAFGCLGVLMGWKR